MRGSTFENVAKSFCILDLKCERKVTNANL